LQRDPIGIAGGLNVYNYGRNSPLGAVDPSGLDPLIVDGVEMPDPDAGGDVKQKRRTYYKRRMHYKGYRGCSWVDFVNPWYWGKFGSDSAIVHGEAMGLYPDPVYPPQPWPNTPFIPPPSDPTPPRPVPAPVLYGGEGWYPGEAKPPTGATPCPRCAE
jgi:hypothetical protein